MVFLIYLLLLIMVLFLYTAVQEGVGFISDFYRDWHILRQFSSAPLTDRARIESDFLSLKTNWGRLRYVQGLKQQRLKPEGAWSQGLPYIKNDPASTLLAQLEERWLGLSDR